jgi:hypothetical protein
MNLVGEPDAVLVCLGASVGLGCGGECNSIGPLGKLLSSRWGRDTR